MNNLSSIEMDVSLEDCPVDPTQERLNYHRLSVDKLEQLDDTEALFERGSRLRNGVGVRKDEEAGWALTIQAARRGHPVARASCFHFGKGVAMDSVRAVELIRGSAERGHAAGCRYLQFKY
jgi:TPR repeat protein